MIDKLIGYLVAFVGLLAGVFIYGQSKKKEGKEEASAEQKDEIIKAVEKANEIKDDNARLGDDDVRRLLRDKYGRR